MADTLVTGRVYEAQSDHGIESVAVSNGDAIVQTDADGRYSLTIDPQQDRYIFISVPEGYRPQDRFYALLPSDSAPEKCDFALLKAPERACTTFRLAHLSDTHVVIDGSGAVSPDLLEQDLQDIANGAAPDFAIITGDLTNMGTVAELESYRQAIESVAIPVVSVFGGHDGNIERRGTNAEIPCTLNFEATLGPTYYSFDWGGYHFVVYATEDSYFTAAGRARKERWLWADLALQPSDRKSVLMLHTSPDQALLEEFRRHGGALILHGHWHSSRVLTMGNTVQASVPAACFGGIDTRPRGCRLVDFSPSGIKTGLLPHSRNRAKGVPASPPSKSEPHTQAASSLSLGNTTYSQTWRRDVASPFHRAAPISLKDSVLVSLQSESHPGRNGVTSYQLESGEEQWHYATQAAIKNTCVATDHDPSGAASGALCAALTVTGELHLMELQSGKRRWSVEMNSHPFRWVYSSPAFAGCRVLAGSKAGYGAYNLATGAQEWSFSPSDGDEWPSYIRPQIHENELGILSVQRSGFLALNMEDGGVVWERDLPVEYFCGSPVLSGDLVVVSSAPPHTGVSLTGGSHGGLAVLEARTGEIVYHNPEALPGYATELAVADGCLYAATAAGTVHCLDLGTGEQAWEFQAGEDLLDMTPYRRGIRSLLAAPLPLDGLILIGACDGWLYALDRESGECTDQVNLHAPITASPCATPQGFCVGTYDGTLYAFSSNLQT
jgi:outer membrane protein assembly factor BamB/predicted phosphodiesterase